MASLSRAAVHNLMEGKYFLVVVAVTQQAVWNVQEMSNFLQLKGCMAEP